MSNHAQLRSAVLLALGSIASLPLSAPAMAQSAGLALEEIVISARKESESLQDAPVSVTAITDEGLIERGIVDPASLAGFTPGLSFSQAFGRQNDRPVIRGQGNVLANVQFGVESGTAYFVDGVYYNGDIQSLDFDSLQRVEVIKGPQSALYGRNTYAGAINFVTRDPGTEKLGGFVTGTVGDHGEQKVAFSIDGPLWSDTVSFRLGGRFNTYDGEYTNRATGKTVGSEEDWSVSGTLLIAPEGGPTLRLFGMHRKQEDGPLALFLQGTETNNCQPGFRSAGYRAYAPFLVPAIYAGMLPLNSNTNQYYCGRIAARPDGVWLNTDPIPAIAPFTYPLPDGTAFDGVESSDTFVSANLKWETESGWTLGALYGHRINHDRFGSDSDHSQAFWLLGQPGGIAEPLFANTNRNSRREWSTELKLSSPADRRLRGMVGLYRYDNEDSERDLTFAAPRFGVINASANETGIQNDAFFAALSFDFNDKLTAGLELRNFDEQKTRREYTATGAVSADLKAKFSRTTPRITLDYQASDDLMVYGIYAKGSRPGGINGSAGLAVDRPTYAEETSDNFELGFKSTLMDGRMTLNGSVYFIDSKDVQVTQAIPGGNGAVTSVAVNQASAETFGIELESQIALTEYLTATLALGYTNPEFTEGCDDFEFVLNSGGIAYNNNTDFGSEACSIKGNRLPLVPETQASLLVSYERPMSNDMRFFVNGTYTHEGSKYVQVHNLAETGETNLLGLRLGVKGGDRWTVALFGRNLTDEDTIPLATRWFDLRYGSCPSSPASPCAGLAGAAPLNADRGLPRAFFSALRKGRTYGAEFRLNF
ncbi:MAG: TonB-dependent receptor [Steroidobacteraceae bacterium]